MNNIVERSMLWQILLRKIEKQLRVTSISIYILSKHIRKFKAFKNFNLLWMATFSRKSNFATVV